MRRIYLLVLAVVLVATLVGLASSEQAGYVLIAYKSFRYESSLWSFLALLAVVWLLVYLAGVIAAWRMESWRREIEEKQGAADAASCFYLKIIDKQ